MLINKKPLLILFIMLYEIKTVPIHSNYFKGLKDFFFTDYTYKYNIGRCQYRVNVR